MAQSQMQTIAFKTHTISSTALTLAAISTPFTAALLRDADEVFITVETESIRYRLDGTAPTASVGHLVAAAGSFTVTGKRDLNNLRIIRVTNDSTVMISLKKRV